MVAAVIKKQQLWELFHAHSRSPSVLSDASDFSSFSALEEGDVSFGYSSTYNNLKQPQVSKSKNPSLVFISDDRPIFDFEDLMRASAKILGRGTFGCAYAAILNNGTAIVIKRLKMVNISEQDFQKRIGIAGDVKHENVAALRAYFYSNDEKLLMYDIYHGWSVSALLHGKTGEVRANVDWQVRLRIAIGAARGISHIHTQNGGKLVHGNIKSSNIFLNSQQYGLVSDLGLASMISTTFPQSSRFYAPEVKSTRNISQASDVYSFGILLLELLTRKSPDLSLGHEAVDLAKLVNSVSRKEWTKLFDGDLLLNISIREQILGILEIGISCVAKNPKKRPKMSAVVNMIEDISMMNMGNQDSGKSDSLNTGNQVSTQIKKEWTEMYEPGVYITIIAFLDGRREIKMSQFSRDHFKNQEAEIWWGENKYKVYETYINARPTSRSTKEYRPGVYISQPSTTIELETSKGGTSVGDVSRIKKRQDSSGVRADIKHMRDIRRPTSERLIKDGSGEEENNQKNYAEKWDEIDMLAAREITMEFKEIGSDVASKILDQLLCELLSN